MARLLRRLRTLQWRLTLSYVLVTVMTLLVLQGAVLSAIYFFVLNPPALAQTVAGTLRDQAAPQIMPYLLQSPPNIMALHTKITPLRANQNGTILGGLGSSDTRIISSVMVLDRQGGIITEDHTAPAFTPAATLAALGGSAALRPILTSQANVITKLPNGTTFVAVPIVNIDGSTLGVFAITINLPLVRTAFLGLAVKTFLPSAILLTIATAAVGTLFGIFVSRGLARRLQRISTAADAWSKGDFAAQVPDRAVDELGELAQHLNGMADQVQALLTTSQALAVVEERNRLARDLHDSVKQQVFATAMQLAAARALLATNSAVAEQRLIEAQHLISQAQGELTGLIGELRPAALGDQGLVAALTTLGAEWSQRTDIAFDLRAQGEQATPLAIEQTLFRVAQEALANIARHSGATHADVQLTWADDLLKLTIQDDGHGFDATSASKGVGLHSMVERVEALGGLVAISSSTSTGTRIALQVPLPHPPAPSPSLMERGRAVFTAERIDHSR